MNNKAIGVFDSGLGGLTVVKEIRKILPYERIEYLGDTARVPYGTRSRQTIINFAKQDINFLKKRDVKAIVVACNTVSSVATDILKSKTTIPLFDVITPTCEYIRNCRKYKKIGVIGTNATIESNIYEKKINQIGNKVKLIYQKAPLLVPLIEEGEGEENYTYLILKKYLQNFKKEKVEAVILACTHYPVLIDLFREILGKNVDLINPGKYVALNLKMFLRKNNLHSGVKIFDSYRFSVTDLTEEFNRQVKVFLGKNLDDKLVKVNLTGR